MTPYDPRQQSQPPQFRSWPQQQPWEPPKRKSWVRRHKILTSLLSVAVLVVAMIIIAAANSGTSARVASLAACTSHKAVGERAWALIAKDPDAHKGECLTVYGEVTQADSATGTSAVRASVGGAPVKPQFGFATYPTNVIIGAHGDELADLVQGDLFTMQVTMAGHEDYDNVVGGQTSVPLLRADSVKQTGHLGS